MKTPFENIGDAGTNHAFLTSSEGFDVARLEPITPEGLPGLDARNYLSPEEWQRTVDLVNHAPAMARFMVELRTKLDAGIAPPPSDDFWNPVRIFAADLEH